MLHVVCKTANTDIIAIWHACRQPAIKILLLHGQQMSNEAACNKQGLHVARIGKQMDLQQVRLLLSSVSGYFAWNMTLYHTGSCEVCC